MESIAMFLKWRNASYPANILFRCGDLKWQSSNSSICLYGFRCLRPIQKTLHMSIHCPNHPKSSHSSWICPIEVAKFGVGLPFSKSHFGAFWEPGGRWDWQRGAAAAELKQVTEEIEEQRKLLSQDCSDHRQRSETIAIPQKNIYMEYPHWNIP
jgi:hypothetical protein